MALRYNDILLTPGEEFSMKVYRLLPVAALALFAGCSGDSVSKVVTPDPHAAIRWVNAVPDTISMDYRIVDIVTNANEAAIKYGASSGAYRALPPGQHRIRVFPDGTTAACNGPGVVSQVLLDTTFTFAANHYYTILHAGYMKAGATPQQRLIISDDVFPAAGAGTVAIRAFDALGNAGATDVFVTAATAAGGAVSGAAAFPNLAFGTASSYGSVAAAATSPATSTLRVTATAKGSTTPLLADGLAPIGAAAFAGSTSVPPLDPIGGAQQAGSVLTAVLLPPTVSYTLTSSGGAAGCKPVGTKTVVAGSTTGAGSVAVLVDKNPKDAVLGQ
jgi:hypothetical protein